MNLVRTRDARWLAGLLWVACTAAPLRAASPAGDRADAPSLPSAPEAVQQASPSPQAAADKSSPSSEIDSRVTVSGQVFRQGTWCRGTAPTQSDLEILEQLVPTSKQLLVRAGSKNAGQPIYAEVLAHGPDGRFEVRLPPGQWCFVEEARRDPVTSVPSRPPQDEACLLRHEQRCDGVVTVEPRTPLTNVQLVYRDTCHTRHPCYRGPLPP